MPKNFRPKRGAPARDRAWPEKISPDAAIGERRIRAGAFPPSHRFSRIANRAGTL
jgi:hypothetical protein